MLFLNSFNLYNQSQVGSNMTFYNFRISVLNELLPAISKSRLDTKRKHTPKTHEMGKQRRPLHFPKDAAFVQKIKFLKILHTSVLLALIVQVYVLNLVL